MTGTDGFGDEKCIKACILEPNCMCFDFLRDQSKCTLLKVPNPFVLTPNKDHDAGCVDTEHPEMTQFTYNKKLNDKDALQNPGPERQTKAYNAQDCKQMCLYDVDCACWTHKTSDGTCSMKVAEGYSVISSKDHKSGCRNGGIISGYTLFGGDVMNAEND